MWFQIIENWLICVMYVLTCLHACKHVLSVYLYLVSFEYKRSKGMYTQLNQTYSHVVLCLGKQKQQTKQWLVHYQKKKKKSSGWYDIFSLVGSKQQQVAECIAEIICGVGPT